MALPNDIGDDWVPVKDTVFKEEKVGRRLIFSVAWNIEESKVKSMKSNGNLHTFCTLL